MYKKIMITGLSAFFACNSLFADDLYLQELPLVWSSIITLSGGPSWGTAGQNQYLYPIHPPFFDYYTYTSDTSVMANAEIFFGLQRIVYPGITGELGLGVAGVSDAKITGVVNVNGAPDVNTYEYKVNHVRVDLKGKLIGSNCAPLQPYISGSLGAGWNNSHNFIPVTVNEILYPTHWFASNTTIAFAYTLGAGVQTKITPSWQVGVGYEFADLGKSFLGPDGNTLTKGLRLTHLYTNELLFSLSYLFS